MAEQLFFRIFFWFAFLVSFAYLFLIIEIVSKIVTRIQYLTRNRAKQKLAPTVLMDDFPEVSYVD